MLTALCCLLSATVAQSSYGQATGSPRIVITDDQSQIAIAGNIEYYEDSSELLSVTDILAPNFDVNFIPHRNNIVHFGLTSATYWLRFSLDWSGVDATSTRILEFGPPKLVSDLIRGGIELYVVDSNRNVAKPLILGTQAAHWKSKP